MATLLIGVGVPALNASSRSLALAAAAVVLLLAALGASFVVPWQRLGARATLAFPVLVCGALVLLSVFDAPTYTPLSGLLALCFAFIGLTQPPRTALAMVPVAGVAFVLISGGWSAAVVIRLLIAGAVWSILGELLAHLRVRQETLSEALRAAAHLDVLTGVGNRRDLDVRLAAAGPGDALVLCDLDHFKRLNDTHGHRVGDQVLADFGSMLRATLRTGDYCARYGGEEFVLVLPHTTRARGRRDARAHACALGRAEPDDDVLGRGVLLLGRSRRWARPSRPPTARSTRRRPPAATATASSPRPRRLRSRKPPPGRGAAAAGRRVRAGCRSPRG